MIFFSEVVWDLGFRYFVFKKLIDRCFGVCKYVEKYIFNDGVF